jgi:phage shock protein C
MSNVPQQRLHRSTRDRWIAGVCGGLAESLGLSPAGIRLVFFLFGWFGIGELVYIALWILLPKR